MTMTLSGVLWAAGGLLGLSIMTELCILWSSYDLIIVKQKYKCQSNCFN